ncbi:MAG: Crp/Fnr family transcriptional regulator [Nitrospirae bacterium]|nr:Crp/Fnr family transcriptional regulator [Nitrospirota bacterium]
MTCNCQDCIIRDVTIFSDLGEGELKSISLLIHLSRYRKHQILFLEDNPAHTVFIIKSGMIKVSKSLEDGREQILRVLRSGDILGFEAIYEDSYSATAEALSKAELCCLNKERLLQLLETNSRISFKMMKALGKELEEAQSKIRDLGLKNAREKMATFLLSQVSPSEKSGDKEKKLTLGLSRQEISDMVGLSQETVSRILSEFKKDKIIKTDRKEIVILKPDKLTSLSS